MSIYEQLKNAGIPLDNHESDLYALKTDVSTQIIEQYEFKSNVITFTSQIDGKIWYDIPFNYDPYWISKQAK